MKPPRQSIIDAEYSVREIAEKASRMDDVVRLDIGQPDFDSPPEAKEAAKEAIDNNHIIYTSLWGIDELRDEITEYESHKGDYDRENVMVTTGGTGALYSLFSTLCEPEEKILFNDPSWPVYSMISKASAVEGERVPYVVDGELNQEAIEGAIDDNTKALLVNNPENPSGKVYSREELEGLADIAENHDLWLIGDEVYDHLTYGAEHVSVAEVAPERSLVVNSMSKNFAMTGWRIGWVLSPDEDLIHEMGKVNRATTASPNFVSQYAALTALRESEDYVEGMVDEFKERKELVEDYLDDMGLDYTDPEGAIYIFPEIGQDSWEFARTLLKEAGVAVVPGAPSGEDSRDNIRICFGSVEKDEIQEGMERLQEFLDR